MRHRLQRLHCQENAARVAKKKAEAEVFVPETSEDEDEESASESEESEEDPPQEDMPLCAGLFKGCVSKKLVTAESV